MRRNRELEIGILLWEMLGRTASFETRLAGCDKGFVGSEVLHEIIARTRGEKERICFLLFYYLFLI